MIPESTQTRLIIPAEFSKNYSLPLPSQKFLNDPSSADIFHVTPDEWAAFVPAFNALDHMSCSDQIMRVLCCGDPCSSCDRLATIIRMIQIINETYLEPNGKFMRLMGTDDFAWYAIALTPEESKILSNEL